MSTAVAILLLALLGSALAGVAALVFARMAHPGWVGTLVGFAVGTLLGVAFLEILPQLLRAATQAPVTDALLGSISESRATHASLVPAPPP